MFRSTNQKHEAYLILENGKIFTGIACGVEGTACGELIFNTSMTGYQEVLSDPSYADQMIVFTYPHIGNVGVNIKDQESSFVWPKGIICRSFSPYYSNWRAESSLEQYLTNHNVVGISEIDTRALTHIVRNSGSLWGCIITCDLSLEQALEGLESAKKETNKIVDKVSIRNIYTHTIEPAKYNLVVYDFGVKKSILSFLLKLGCRLTVVPWNTSFEEALTAKPDGIVLSNGPGDPRECHEAIKAVSKFLEVNIPMLGICLGHQILALACGAKIFKMKYGHHGTNHPVMDIKNSKVLISSQNHDFAVMKETIPSYLSITHLSLFDGSVQGIKHIHKHATGFQGHPEGGPGPSDLSTLFSDFINILKLAKENNHPMNLRKQVRA